MNYLINKERIGSGILYLVSFLYVFNAYTLLMVHFLFDTASSSDGIYVSFLREFPTFGLVPLMSISASLIFLYLAIKIRSLSKNVFNISLFLVLVIPILTLLLSKVFMAPFINISGADTGTGVLGVNLATSNMPVFFNLILFFSVLAFLTLLFARKRFTQPSSSLSSRAKKWLLVFTTFIVLPVIGLSAFSYMRSFESDFGYTKMQSEVSFHIYRPDLSNTNWENRSFYKKINAPATNNSDGVQAAFSKPFFESFDASEGTSNIIVIQSKVGPKFDLTSFIAEFIPHGDSNVEPITTVGHAVSIAKDLAIQHLKTNENDIYWLVFTTDDNVLVVITGVSTDLNDLVQFANLLY